MSQLAPMRWAAAGSTAPEAAAAAEEVSAALADALGPGRLDFLSVFFRSPHVKGVEAMATVLRERLNPACLVGASGHAVVGNAHEHEKGPALTALGGRLPGVTARPFVMDEEAWAEAADDPLAFAQIAPGLAGAEIALMISDPFSFDLDNALGGVNRHAKGVRVVGGMASAGPRPGTNVLILNDWIGPEGGVAVALHGALRADVAVSQGCRPIGPPLEVTASEGHILIELDGQPALERAEQVLRALEPMERERLKHGLYVGRPARAGASGRGDYLVRNLLGADRDRGVLAVGDRIEARERVRLHVRDGETAREDLEMVLSPQGFDSKPAAALVFSCNGRGRGMYGRPDGDISIIQDALGGDVPAAGMFCAGEVGPVGERNFLHGHTASIAILRPARDT